MGDYNNPNENNNNQLNNPDPNQAQNNQPQNGQAPYQQPQNGQAPYQQPQNEQAPNGQTPYQQPQYQQPQYQSSQYQQYDQNQNQNQNQNQYQQYPQYQDINKPKNNGMAIGSLVCGIISFVVSCCWFISLPLSIASIVLGILVLKNKKDGRTLAIIGIVLAGITVLIAISVLIIGQLAVSGNNQFFNEILEQYNYDLDMKEFKSTY